MEIGILVKEKTQTKKLMKPERLFLIVTLVAGLIFAIAQPLFIEPDSSYHFDKSSYLSNTVVDRTKIGFPAEDYQSAPLPFTTVTRKMKDGTYFKDFFETKLPLVSKSKVTDKRALGKKWYQDIMHLIPALGVKVGYMIYPSVGSMVLVARLFSLIFFVLTMYFIIKKLKAYQMIFTIISVTPVAIQFATSLSYDSYNYIVFAWLSATLINLAVELQENKEIQLKDFFLRIILPSIALYFSKANSRLLYLIVLAVFIVIVAKKLKLSLTKLQVLIGSGVLIGLGALVYIFRYHDQLCLVVSKFLYTFMEPYYSVLTTQVISGTSTAAIPAWFYPIQYGALILLFLSYTKEQVPRWFAWLGLLINLINLFGVLFKFAIDPAFTEHVITGPQGRYFTVFILLLAPILTLLAQKISVKSTGSWLRRIVLFVSLMALALNLGVTTLRSYHLHLPMDEYRSGIEHYIFK
ncbi:DUF2142 domain-containing protein [Lactococcus lactis]|uniref:DUF2142 domain-containing protein n=1 Tax=Lactococcus lactis TaxID=1358 RepID=UPI00071CB6F3|nr:DUF2142 domain-containing protein [Lactococcus lactis]